MALGVMPNRRCMAVVGGKTERRSLGAVVWLFTWRFCAGAVGGAVFALAGCPLLLLLCCGMHVFVLRYPVEFAVAGALVGALFNSIRAVCGKPDEFVSPNWQQTEPLVFTVVVTLLALGWRFGMPSLVTAYAPGAAQDRVFITKSGRRYHRAYCDYLPAHPRQTSRQAARLLGLTGCKACRAAARP